MESFGSAEEGSLPALNSEKIGYGSRAANKAGECVSTAESSPQTVLKSDQIKTETDEVDQIKAEQQGHSPDGNTEASTENATQTESIADFAEIEIETEDDQSECGSVGKRRSGLQVSKRFSKGVYLRTSSETNLGEAPLVSKDSGKQLLSSKVTEGQEIPTVEKLYTYRPHQCPDCGKSFRKSGNLKRHQLIHQRKHPKVKIGEEPYSCSDCGKSFCHLGNLKQHQLIHTDESYSCTVCGKIFFRLGNLERHQLFHTGQRLYSCAECGKSFTHLGSLHTHQRIHKGGKIYTCMECGEGFCRLGSFKEHQRIHTIEKEYTCIICGDSFSHLGHFKQHEQVHTKETMLLP